MTFSHNRFALFFNGVSVLESSAAVENIVEKGDDNKAFIADAMRLKNRFKNRNALVAFK